MNVEIKRFPSRVLSIRYSVSKLNMAPGMLWLNDNAPNVCVEFLRADMIRGVGSSFMDISQIWRCKVHAVNRVGRTDGALLDSLKEAAKLPCLLAALIGETDAYTLCDAPKSYYGVLCQLGCQYLLPQDLSHLFWIQIHKVLQSNSIFKLSVQFAV